MESHDPATSVGREPRQTEVGSNFVSNYPPYSFWSEEALPSVEAGLDRAPDAGAPLGIYVHVPFCRRRCKFCYFKVFTDKNARDIRRYLDAVAREAEALAGRAAIAGRSPRFVYVGGGTPSYISARDMADLFATLKRLFSWESMEEVTFECEPGTLTRPKLEAIREAGVTRISLGVESFDDRILAENGRAHTTKEIDRVAPWVRALSFDQVNIDLISGMVGETWETWQAGLEKTLAMDPDSVTIYQMELPYNTVYSKSLLDGRPVEVADWETKRRWHAHAIDTLTEAGYRVSSAYTMVRPGRDGRFVYRDSVWQGCDLLGLGLSSFSHVGGVHFQNDPRWEGYLERIESGRAAATRAFETSADERLVRETILLLKRGYLELDRFRDRHGVELTERFRQPLADLSQRGLLRVAGDRIELTRDGLLRADQLLPRFYDEKYQNARYT